MTLLTSLGDQAKFWHGVIPIPNESPRNKGCITSDMMPLQLARVTLRFSLNGFPCLDTQKVIQTSTNAF